MSEVKTTKQEALDLLAIASPTDEQERRLFELVTAKTGTLVFRDTRSLWSVDACLYLIYGYRFVIHYMGGAFRVRLYNGTDDADGTYADAASLNLAILRAWWKIQPDDQESA